MFTILGSVLNMGNVVFEVAEDEGAMVYNQEGALRITAVRSSTSPVYWGHQPTNRSANQFN